ncbi:MAG TPA: dUTP diphosphatase [Patescibacteria group bacterium]|nr:dUTP diphosphatase [Patescibacteria group bacterium]
MIKKTVKFTLLSKNAKLPSYAHNDDAGFDIYTNETTILKKGEYKGISTGVSSEIPKGYFVSFRDKSGLAFNFGLHTLGGVIDAGYRGEWKVIMVNLGKKNYKFENGDKVAQGILQIVPHANIVNSKSLSTSKRGKGGFGSTGKK